MPWTRFVDMRSGGSIKVEPYQNIYIEAPKKEACAVFFNRFKRNPDCVTSASDGSDYNISESATIEQATGFERNCARSKKTGKYIERQEPRNIEIRKRLNTPKSDKWGLYLTVKQYMKKPNVLFIRADEIKDDELTADIPSQGYVWVD